MLFTKNVSLTEEIVTQLKSLRKDLKEVSFKLPNRVDIKGKTVPKASFDGIRFILSYMDYLEVGRGVRDRLVSSQEDIKFPFEESHKEALKQVDFKKYDVVFSQFDGDAEMQDHYHNTEETLYCLEGSYIGDSSELNIYKKGQIQKIPANMVHCFKALEPGFLLITLKK